MPDNGNTCATLRQRSMVVRSTRKGHEGNYFDLGWNIRMWSYFRRCRKYGREQHACRTQTGTYCTAPHTTGYSPNTLIGLHCPKSHRRQRRQFVESVEKIFFRQRISLSPARGHQQSATSAPAPHRESAPHPDVPGKIAAVQEISKAQSKGHTNHDCSKANRNGQ